MYRDTLYVDDLVAPGTVDTMPGATPNAIGDLAAVESLGGGYDEVVTRLEEEGAAKFAVAWQDLPDAVTKPPTSKGVDAE